MKVVIIDDELPAIERLEHLLELDGRCEVVRTFTDPIYALEYLKANTVQVVFTDIDMPFLNGIDLGISINKECTNTIIIYTTAYSDYTLEAYKNQAIGYLLKPISKDILSTLIDKLYGFPIIQNETKPNLIVNTLGSFLIKYRNQSIKFRTKKSQELFCFLLHNENSWVHFDKIICNLFNNNSNNQLKGNLHTNISYCRKAFKDIGIENIIDFKLSSYKVSCPNLLWDYRILHKKLTESAHKVITRDDFNAILEIDKGSYFYDMEYAWSYSTRASLEIRLKEFYINQLKNTNLTSEDKVKLLKIIEVHELNINDY